MYRMLEKEAVKSLENAIESLGYEKPSEIKVEEPPNADLGDLASTVSFQLAKQLKKPPMEITKDILNVIELPEVFRSVEMKGPYINFFINYDNFSKLVLDSIDENYGQLEDKNKKIILEHTSANPNGPLHIGHVRNAIIGDSLARILRSAGYNVETQYYVNDMGRQIGIIAWGLLNFDFKIEEKEKVDHEIGKIYFQINEKLRADESLKTEVSALLKRYESGTDPELDKVFKNIVEKCISGIESTLNDLNIYHDAFVWESKFIRNQKVSEILDKLS